MAKQTNLDQTQNHLENHSLQEKRLEQLEKQLQKMAQEKAQVQNELRSAVERLQIIQNIESNILEAESAESISDTVLKNLNSIIPCMSSAVTLFDHKHHKGTLLAGFNTIRKPGSRFDLSIYPITADLFNGKISIINDLRSVSTQYPGLEIFAEKGGRSIMLTPLISQNNLIGSIIIISRSDNAFKKREKEIVNQISKSLAVAIQNAQILQTERKARREADILREIAANINSQVDQEMLLEQILDQLAHVLPYDTASILQYKDEKLIVVARNGPLPYKSINKEIFNPIPSNLTKLIVTQKPMIIPDTSKYPDWKIYPEIEHNNCWMGVPLIAKGSFYGILMLAKWEPNFYDEHSEKLALAFANQAAISIENARLYRETQKFGERMQQQVALRTRDLAALYEITATTSQFSDLKSILDKVISKIASSMDCEQVTLHLLDDSGEKLKLVSSLGMSPQIAQSMRVVPLDHFIIQLIVESNEPYFTQAGNPDPLAPGEKLPSNIKNGLGAPIRYKGKFLGILGLINKKQPFTREDIALITSISDQIGIAIENDQLRKKSERALVTQERERLARDLHDSITQSLFSLTLFAATARELLRNGSVVGAEDFLKDIAVTSNQTHKEMRLLLYELRPSALTEEGLLGALRHRLDAVESRSGIKSTLTENLSKKLPPNVEGALFQVANEALNNTLKHSQATKVKVTLDTQDDRVQLEIRDNGIGFKAEADVQESSMGMISMKQRMASINGSFMCQTSPGNGTVIFVSAPLS